MNRRLATEIIGAFREERINVLRDRFAPFDEREWLQNKEWLHTSGLALPFLARVRELGIADIMPAQVLDELEHNHAQNRVRTEDLFDEFVKINMEFQRARLSYANLKGFTLAPRSFVDPAYRYQHDLDFLVSRHDAERCRQAVERHGYRLDAVYGDTWEFRAGIQKGSSIHELYKVRPERSLEVHLVSEREQGESDWHSDRLSRLQLQVWNGFEFPALSECDKLLAQAQHLFKHFQTEWTRTAWMLEYANAIRSHRDNESFWRETVAAIEAEPETKIGIGMASLITNRAFGVELPTQFRACTVDELPEQARLWAARYEDELVFIEHPGSKLYLLLQDVLMQDDPDWLNERRRRLLPLRLPPKITAAARGKDRWQQLREVLTRLCFIGRRLRFHVAEGLHYKIESARWRKFVAHLQA